MRKTSLMVTKEYSPNDGYTLVGYCTANNLPQFVLDPPRGKPHRVALVVFARADETDGLQMHKFEILEPENVKTAVA